MEKLTDDNFIIVAMHNYDNPSCQTLKEFEEDIKRFLYLRKLFGRYISNNELKERLILNHIIVLYNVFGNKATQMLFYKVEPIYWSLLKTFLIYLEKMPDAVTDINIPSDLTIDHTIAGILRNL